MFGACNMRSIRQALKGGGDVFLLSCGLKRETGWGCDCPAGDDVTAVVVERHESGGDLSFWAWATPVEPPRINARTLANGCQISGKIQSSQGDINMIYTTSKGRTIETSLDLSEAHRLLREIRGSTFAADLASRPLERLSADQRIWVLILAQEHLTPEIKGATPSAQVNGILAAVQEILAAGAKALKHPRVRIMAGERQISLSIKSDAGVIYVKDLTRTSYSPTYGETPLYYGKIDKDGRWLPASNCPDEILPALQEFAAAPVQKVKQYGLLIGNCSFCGKRLTKEDSTRNGYGAICAETWGLPY